MRNAKGNSKKIGGTLAVLSPTPTKDLLELYPMRQSYAAGEIAEICCSSRVASFRVEVIQASTDDRVVCEIDHVDGQRHSTPNNASTKGCDWPVAFSIPIDETWRSGFYIVRATSTDQRYRGVVGEACFVVRCKSSMERAKILMVVATNTYNAYNDWGGDNLYNGAVEASFLRPYPRGMLSHLPGLESFRIAHTSHLGCLKGFYIPWRRGGSSWVYPTGWARWESIFAKWAYKNGFELDFAVNADLEMYPELLKKYKLMLSVGHDEYWSWRMRDTAEAFVASGGNICFFSGNTCFWQVRFESDHDRMVCYKSQAYDDPVLGTEKERFLTGIWSDRRVGRRENKLLGLSFTRGGFPSGPGLKVEQGGYRVHRADHWVFDGTGLKNGDILGNTDLIIGLEADGCEFEMVDGVPTPTGRDDTPTGFEILGTAPTQWMEFGAYLAANGRDIWSDPELICYSEIGRVDENYIDERLNTPHAVMGLFENNGVVFNAGTIEWAYGLRGNDPQVEKVTHNLLKRLGA